MKILAKTTLVIFILVLFLLAIFPASPLRSLISRIILSNQTILSELNFNKDNCHYEEPTMIITNRTATFVCITDMAYKITSDAQKAAVADMRDVLEKNGWTFSDNESWNDWNNIVYYKGSRKIRIGLYDWGPGPGCKGVIEEGSDLCKLSIRLQ